MKNSDKPNRKSSERQKNASRQNGAKSHGPVTPEGKAKCSLNALKHGLLSTISSLSCEEEVHFREIEQSYIARFQPRDAVEQGLVEQIAWAHYRMRLCWIDDLTILSLQVAADRDDVNKEWDTPNNHDHRALATIASLKDSNALALVQRYSRSLAMQSERAIKLLLQLQKLPLQPAAIQPPAEDAPELPNGPDPKIGHPEIAANTVPDPGPEPEIEPQPDVHEPAAFVQTIVQRVSGWTRRINPRPEPSPLLLAKAA